METEPASAVCPFCISPLVGQVGVCPECETPHHQDCWQANGGCTTLGCRACPRTLSFRPRSLRNVRSISAGDAPVSDVPVEPLVIPARLSRFRQVLATGLVVGAIVLGVFWVGVAGLGRQRMPAGNPSSRSTVVVREIEPRPGGNSASGDGITSEGGSAAQETGRRSPSPTPTRRRPTNPPPPPQATGRVNTTKLNVRRGPGTEYGIITQITKGTRVTIIGTHSARVWWQIRLPDGTIGWVHGKYIDESGCISCVQVSRVPPTPAAKPASVDPHFRADRTSVRPGECTTLRWYVEGIKEVYLDGHGQVGHGSQQVCPSQTQTFVLTVVQRDGQRVPHRLTIQVSGSPVAVSQFVIRHKGCIGGTSRGIGLVKGQVFRRNGQIIVGAVVEVLIEGQRGIVPPGRTNQDGWYEWNLTPGQRVRFVSLVVDGRSVAFTPANFEVISTGGCYQRVDFVER